jgi:hypothetical protein
MQHSFIKASQVAKISMHGFPNHKDDYFGNSSFQAETNLIEVNILSQRHFIYMSSTSYRFPVPTIMPSYKQI